MSFDRGKILSQLEPALKPFEENLDIAEMALLLASLDLPNEDLAPYRKHLDNISLDLGVATRSVRHTRDLAIALSDVLFGVHGYAGDTATFNDMQNANIMRVIDRRKGLPVALGILLIHMARTQGWNITGLNFPGYFLLRITHEGEQILIDPFNKAQRLTIDKVQGLITQMRGPSARLQPHHLQSVSDRDVILRLQNNIKARAMESDDPERALEVIERMYRISPNNAGLVSEMAVLEAEKGNIKRSLESLSDFLVRWEGHPEEEQISALSENLRRRLN